MNFTGNDVQRVMQIAGVKSARELAKRIGVNPQTVYNWVARKSEPLSTRAQMQLERFTKHSLSENKLELLPETTREPGMTGKALYTFRKNIGMFSLKQFSDAVGLAENLISDWERNQDKVLPEEIERRIKEFAKRRLAEKALAFAVQTCPAPKLQVADQPAIKVEKKPGRKPGKVLRTANSQAISCPYCHSKAVLEDPNLECDYFCTCGKVFRFIPAFGPVRRLRPN